MSSKPIVMNLCLRLILMFLLLVAASSAHAERKVVASIKPLHSLVAGVMKGVGTPELVIDGNASPHSHNLKPSQARTLQDAEVIFWVGPDMESGLEKQVETLGVDARVFKMMDVPGVTRLTLREDSDFEGHAHDDHAAEKSGHDGHEIFDTHIWLDPQNARAMVLVIAAALSESDPENATTYASNASDLTAGLQKLEDEIANLMVEFKDKPVIVYHDAYRHFENRFGLHVVGSLSNNPDAMPGAARIVELRARIKTLGAVCVLSEPQFSSTMIATIVEDTQARPGIVDPLGSSLANGPELYFTLLRNMATAIGDCLAG